MSHCQKEGKDKIIFATKEDHEKPSSVKLAEDEDDDEPGLILPSGEINWSCPCLGGMATGPCGMEFRDAFSCFHHSNAEPKGSDCFAPFKTMQECMLKYPKLYPVSKDDDDGGVASIIPDDDQIGVTNQSSGKTGRQSESDKQ